VSRLLLLNESSRLFDAVRLVCKTFAGYCCPPQRGKMSLFPAQSLQLVMMMTAGGGNTSSPGLKRTLHVILLERLRRCPLKLRQMRRVFSGALEGWTFSFSKI
jgi:hypothetical protein